VVSVMVSMDRHTNEELVVDVHLEYPSRKSIICTQFSSSDDPRLLFG